MTKRFKNRIINEQIDKWISIDPVYQKVFDNYDIFIKAADELAVEYSLKNNDLALIIDGFVYSSLSININSTDCGLYSEKATEYLQPLFIPLIKHINSDSYKEYIISQQITEKDTLEVNNIKTKIDLEALLHHAKKTKKLLIKRTDAEELEKEFIKYKKELYQEPAKIEKLDNNKIEREINEENLYAYFNSTFKGKGNGNINYFKTLIEELKTDRNAYEFAQIAFIIYNSKYFNKREFNKFSKWLKFFFKQINVKYVYYKPCRLKIPNSNIQNNFKYLL